MTLLQLEALLGFNMPYFFRIFLEKYPEGYTPERRIYVDGTLDIFIHHFYGIDELYEVWNNTKALPEIEINRIILIAENLGNNETALGINPKNLDMIYYLDWHEGLTVIKPNIEDFLLALVRDA